MSNGNGNKLPMTQEEMLNTSRSLKHPSYDVPAVEGDLPFEPLTRWDKGLLRDTYQGDVRARNQPNSRAILNSIVQIGSTIVGDAVAGVGYLGEIGNINDIVQGKETEWGNWLTELGQSIKEKGEEIAPVYASQKALTTFAPFDKEWWASNIPSIGSTLALAIPAIGTVGLVSRFGKALGIASKMSAKAGQVVRGIGAAIISRHIENMMEGKETFDRAYEEALSQGRSEEEAKQVAGRAASDTYNTNYVNLVTDIPQYLEFLGVKLPGLGKASRLKTAGKGFVSEAAEEATQFIIQEEAARGARLELGTEEDDTSFGQRFVKYLQEPGLQTSAFFGGFGGAVFGAIGHSVDKAEADPEEVRQQAVIEQTAKAADTGDFEKPIATVAEMKNDPELAANEEVQANLAKAEEVLKYSQDVFNSLTGDPFQKEKTVLAAEGKQIEQVFRENDEGIARIRANIKEQDQFNYKFLKMQLDALNKLKKSKVHKEKIAEIKSELEAELKSEQFGEEFKPAKIDAIDVYAPAMNKLAMQRVQAKVGQKITAEAINKLETPEGQQELAQQAIELQKKEEKKIIADAKKADSVESINKSKKDFPQMAEELDKIITDKAKTEREKAPAKIEDFDSAQEFFDARYKGREFLLADDMNKAKVNTPEELLASISELHNRKFTSTKDYLGKEVYYKGERGVVRQDEGGKFTVETEKSVYEVSEKLNEDMLIAVEIERNKQIFSDNTIDYLIVEEEINDLDYSEILNTIWETDLTDTIGEVLDKLYDEKPLTEQEKLQTGLWLQDVYDRISRLFTPDVSNINKEVLLNAFETAEMIRSLLYNLNNYDIKRKGSSKAQTSKPSKKEEGKSIEEIEEEIVKRYKNPENLSSTSQKEEASETQTEAPVQEEPLQAEDIEPVVERTAPEQTLENSLKEEAAAKAATEDVEVAQEIVEYTLRSEDAILDDSADDRRDAEESRNPFLGRTNDAAFYKIVTRSGKTYVKFSGVGEPNRYWEPEKAKQVYNRIKLNAEKWTPLYDNDGNLVLFKQEDRQKEMPEFDFDELRVIGDISGNDVTFEVDTTQDIPSYDQKGYAGFRVLIRTRLDTLSEPVTLAMLPADNSVFQQHPKHSEFISLRKAIWDEWVAQGKPAKFVYSEKGSIADVYSGRFINTTSRNNPKSVLTTEEKSNFTLAVGVSQGDTVHYDNKGAKVLVQSSLKQPTAGAVYMAIKTSNGRYAWSRLFTKKLSDTTARAKPGMFPTWESLRGGFEDVPLRQVMLEIFSFSLTAPEQWKNSWSDLRNEAQSIVRFTKKNKKGKGVDFRENLGQVITDKYSGDVQKFYDSQKLDDRTLQIDSRKINSESYNDLIEDRLSTDLNPYVHTHSPKFEIIPPNVEMVEEPEVTEEEFDFGDDEPIRFRIADEANYPIWNEVEETAWFKSTFPNIPIETVARIKSMGRDAWGAFTNAAGVLVASGAKSGTVFHEAFHVAFVLGLNEVQQKVILDEARKMYPGLSDRQLEEALADSFMEYMQSEKPSTIGARVTRFFRRLLEQLRFAITNKLTIDHFFDRIESGKYSGVSLGAKFETRNKLVASFTNLKEQRQRVKEAGHFFDIIIEKIRTKRGVDYEEAKNIALQTPAIFNSTTGIGDGIPSIYQFFARQRKAGLTKQGEAELDRVLSALKTVDFANEITKNLVSRGVYITMSLSNADDTKVYDEEETFLESWQGKAMQVSPLENMTARLKRFLNTVPILDGRKTVDGQHPPKVSRLKITQRFDGRFLYADLQTRLGASISVEDMMSKLEEASKTLPHYGYIANLASTDSDLRTELFRIAQKAHPEFYDVVREDSGKYTLKSSNTDSMQNVLLRDWFTTYSDPLYNEFLNADGEVVNKSRLESAWNKVSNAIAAGRDASSEFEALLSRVGIIVDPGVLEMAYYANKLPEVADAFKPVLTSLIGGTVSFDNRDARDFAKSLAAFYPITYQSAHFNVEGNKEYEWINSSFLAKRIATLNNTATQDRVWNMLSADPFYSELINNGVIDKNSWHKAKWSVIGGIKHNKGRGTSFTGFSDKDTAITMLSMFKEGWYNTSVNSSSTPVLSAIKLGKVGSREEILNKLEALARAEFTRMSKAKVEGWKNYTPGKYAFFPYLKDNEAPPANLRELIANDLNEQYLELDSRLRTLGIIENEKLAFDTSLDTAVFLQEFINNFNIKQAEMILMMQGDPNFYKTDKAGSKIDDFFKRARQIWSPGNYLDTTASFTKRDGTKIEFPSNGKYNLKILHDIEVPSPQIKDIYDALNTSTGQAAATRISKLYSKVNITDAQSWIDLYSYRLRMIGERRWTNDMQDAYDILITGRDVTEADVTNAVVKGTIFQPIKPFYYALHLYETLIYPMQNKDSEFLLIPSLANKNKIFAQVLEDMGYTNNDGVWSLDEEGRRLGKYTDKVSFESAIKVAMTSPFVGDNLSEVGTVEMNWSDWRRQLETPEHHLDADARFGTQIMKLILSDLADDAVFPDKRTGKDVKEEYEKLVIADIVRSSNGLMSRFTKDNGEIDKEAFVKVIREEVTRRQLGDQYIDALEWTYNDVLGEMDTALPLFHPLHSTRVEAMISSLFKNNITKQKFLTGVSLYNVTSYGFNTAPRIVTNKETGGIDHIECYAPVYSSYLEKYRLPDGEIDIDAIRESEPELLDGLVYRIPTEDKYSMFNIKIIGFLPQAVGGAIVLPPEVTKIAGLDFDIDKTFGYFRSKGNPYKKALDWLDRKIEQDYERNVLMSTDAAVDTLWSNLFSQYDASSPYTDVEVNEVLKEFGSSLAAYNALKTKVENHTAKQDSDNAKLDLMKSILSHPSMTAAFLDPGGFTTIEGVVKQIKSWRTETKKPLSVSSPLTVIDGIKRINVGSALTGIAANYNAAKARWQQWPMTLKDKFVFDSETYNNLSAVDEYGNRAAGRKVSRNIAEVLASAVDNGKTPLAEAYNLNTYTADVMMSMLTVGIPLPTVMMFLSQPSIVKYTEDYFNNGGKEVDSGLPALKKATNITSDELMKSLKEGTTEDNQNRYLQNFIYYKSMVSPIGDLVTATKIPDQGAGPSIADSVVRNRKYTRNLSESIEGANEFRYSDSFHNKFVELGINQALKTFTAIGFPDFTSLKSGIRIAIERLAQVKGSELNEYEMTTVYKHFMEYLASANDMFDYNTAINLHENLHKHITAVKKNKEIQNIFLDRLEVRDKVINFRAVVSIHKEEFDDYRLSWAEMLGDTREIEPGYTMNDLGVDLIKYSFFRAGFTTSGFGNFAHLQPIEFYTQNEQGKALSNHLITAVRSQNSTTDSAPYDIFVDQFVRNNFMNIYYLPTVEKDQVAFNTEGVPVGIVEDERTGKAEFIKYIARDDRGKFAGATLFKRQQGVLVPVTPLGIYSGTDQVMRIYKFTKQATKTPTEVISEEPSVIQAEEMLPEDHGKKVEESSVVLPTETKPGLLPNTYTLNGIEINLQTYRNGELYNIELTKDQRKGLQMLADFADANFYKPDVTPFILKGKAGTGKTTLIRLINEYIKKKFRGSTSIIITTSHRAGRVASMATYGNQGQYRTNASAFSSKFNRPTQNVLIFDEISMNDDYIYNDAMEHIKTHDTLPIFVGDIRQIPPVNGTKVTAFFDSPNQYELTEIVRFQNQGPIFTISDTYAENLKTFDPVTVFPRYSSDGKETIQSYDNRDKFINVFLTTAQAEPDLSSTRIVTYSNNSIRSYTTTIRSKLYAKRRNLPDFEINPFEKEPMTGSAAWSTKKPLESPVLNSVDYIVTEDSYTDSWTFDPSVGQRITATGSVVTMREVSDKPVYPTTVMVINLNQSTELAKTIAYNLYKMKQLPRKEQWGSVFNGVLDSIEKSGFYSIEPIYAKIAGETVTILPDEKGANVIVEPNLAFGYALTAHKAQGGTYKNVFVDEKNMSAFAKERKVYDRDNTFFAYEQNQLKYVGMSRASENLHIFTDKPITESSSFTKNVEEETPKLSNKQIEVQRAALQMASDNIEKVKNGTKTLTNRTVKIPSGVYDIGEGVFVDITYLGVAKVNLGTVEKGVLVTNESGTVQTILLDEFAVREGFKNWLDFVDNNKFSSNFVSGRDTRYIYKIMPITSLPIESTIQEESLEVQNAEDTDFKEGEIVKVTFTIDDKTVVVDAEVLQNLQMGKDSYNIDLKNTKTGKLYAFNMDKSGNVFTQIVGDKVIDNPDITVRRAASEETIEDLDTKASTLWLNHSDKLKAKHPDITFEQFQKILETKGIDHVLDYIKTCL